MQAVELLHGHSTLLQYKVLNIVHRDDFVKSILQRGYSINRYCFRCIVSCVLFSVGKYKIRDSYVPLPDENN